MDFNKFRKENGGTDTVPAEVPSIDPDYIWKTCVAIAKEYAPCMPKPDSVREKKQLEVRKKYSEFVSKYPQLTNKLLASGPDSETMHVRLENIKDMMDKIKDVQAGKTDIKKLHVQVGKEYWSKYNPK